MRCDGIGNCLPEDSTVERNEILIEALHFQLPFPLCYQRLRADNQDIVPSIFMPFMAKNWLPVATSTPPSEIPQKLLASSP